MPSLQSSRVWKCNAGAMLLVLCLPVLAVAQEATAFAGAQPSEHPVVDTEKFFAGAALGLVVHESGHLLFDAIFGAAVDVKRVQFGPVPFFAVSHPPGVPPREEYTISSAGFWTQEATAEWLLTRHPGLREEAAPLVKGVLAFDLLTSVGYGIVGIARAGPPERDTRGMTMIGVPEPAIGALIIVPAVLDGYRYVRPDAAWAKWASRAAKIATVALVMKGSQK